MFIWIYLAFIGFGRQVTSLELVDFTGLNRCCGNVLLSCSGSASLCDSVSESVTFSLHFKSISELSTTTYKL